MKEELKNLVAELNERSRHHEKAMLEAEAEGMEGTARMKLGRMVELDRVINKLEKLLENS